MKRIVLASFVLFLLVSCGYREGVIQKAEKSYLKFAGNWQNALVQIDMMSPFKLENVSVSGESSGKESPDNKLYQVSPGRHDIKIYKDGGVVVNRILLLENQTTTEVLIP